MSKHKPRCLVRNFRNAILPCLRLKGQGIAFLDDVEAAESLAAGRLVRVLDTEIPAGKYVIVQNDLVPETTFTISYDGLVYIATRHADGRIEYSTGK